MKAKNSRRILRHSKNGAIDKLMDYVVTEEPLEIRVNNKSISITMRTPGDDFSLAAGFLLCESIIQSTSDIRTMRHCGAKNGGETTTNIVRIDLSSSAQSHILRLDRHFYASSSCGVCGKSSIEALAISAKPFERKNAKINSELIFALPEKLRSAQALFHQTGGLHGAGLFDKNGVLLDAREDIGRHNAVDKIVGAQHLKGESFYPEHILCISGRASFEILQKAIVARISTIVGVGAPSSLAIDLAEKFNVTLIGFASANRFNVYANS